MEQTWITNRLSWLLQSQSFCILAYVALTRGLVDAEFKLKVQYLSYALPAFGVVCCLFVGLSIRAANRVSYLLLDQRAQLTAGINTELRKLDDKLSIPKIGHGSNRDQKILRTEFWGGLPFHLPWVLLVFWFLLFFNINLSALVAMITPR
jgi:hypothetical protein